jgi:hypothetical protein
VIAGGSRPGAVPMATPEMSRARRLRAPLLILLWALLAFEAVGGLALFFARVAFGSKPGEALHVGAGLALTLVYVAYQWGHWRRVAPWRSRLDYGLGLMAAVSMALTNLSGLVLALDWARRTGLMPGGGAADPGASSSPALIGFHNVASMVVLTFVASHLGAVLRRASK